MNLPRILDDLPLFKDNLPYVCETDPCCDDPVFTSCPTDLDTLVNVLPEASISVGESQLEGTCEEQSIPLVGVGWTTAGGCPVVSNALSGSIAQLVGIVPSPKRLRYQTQTGVVCSSSGGNETTILITGELLCGHPLTGAGGGWWGRIIYESFSGVRRHWGFSYYGRLDPDNPQEFEIGRTYDLPFVIHSTTGVPACNPTDLPATAAITFLE